jgi:hypothetical protein
MKDLYLIVLNLLLDFLLKILKFYFLLFIIINKLFFFLKIDTFLCFLL